MNGGTLRVAWYRYRASFARRWASYLSVVLLIGLVGGLALASLAGARRTASSFPTYVASTNPATLGLFSRYDDPGLGLHTGYDARIANAIAHLPLVERATTSIVFDGNINLNAIKGVHIHLTAGEEPPAILGSTDGEFTSMDRVTLIAGRMANPKNLDEAVMNGQAAQEMGLHIGSVIEIPFYTDAQNNSSSSLGKPFRIVKVKMVGEFIPQQNVIQSDIAKLGSSVVILSQALTRELAPKCSTGTETFLQLKGGDASATRVLSEVYKMDPIA